MKNILLAGGLSMIGTLLGTRLLIRFLVAKGYGQFVRDEARLSLEAAVRKMTSAPAARLGLRDRGVIRDGYVADLVVFDPATIRSTATYEQPRSYPVGIEAVMVAGTPVVLDGIHTCATPGRALRHGRD